MRLGTPEARAASAERAAEMLDSFISRLEMTERDVSRKAMPAKSGRYWYAPFPRPVFLQLLMHVRSLLGSTLQTRVRCEHCGADSHRKASFVDIGCGLADMVVLAGDMGFEGHGIEINPYLIARAKERWTFRESKESRYSAPIVARAWADGTMTLYPADALTFDYSGFDVIYFYRLFDDRKLERQFEQRLWQQAKPGAFVIACAAVTEPPAGAFRRVEECDAIAPRDVASVWRRVGAGAGAEKRAKGRRK